MSVVSIYLLIGFVYSVYVLHDAGFFAKGFKESRTYTEIVELLDSYPFFKKSWYPYILVFTITMCWIGWPYFLYVDIKENLFKNQ